MRRGLAVTLAVAIGLSLVSRLAPAADAPAVADDPRVKQALRLLEAWADGQQAYERLPGLSIRVFDYSEWANHRFLDALATLTAEDCGRELKGSYHRGQVAVFLRQLGTRPPTTDLVAFDRERLPPVANSHIRGGG